MDPLQETLKDVQLRLSLIHRRQLTHKDLARIARVSTRALSEWMRGATAPAGMSALLRLLSELPPEQIDEVLSPWRDAACEVATHTTSDGTRPDTH